MKEKIFEGDLSGLGTGIAKMQTGEAPTIELVTVQNAKDGSLALQYCKPDCPPPGPICTPTFLPCKPRTR